MSSMSLEINTEIMQSLKEVVCILMQKSIPFLPSFLFHILTFSTKKEKKKKKKKEITTTTINILIYVLTKGRSIINAEKNNRTKTKQIEKYLTEAIAKEKKKGRKK